MLYHGYFEGQSHPIIFVMLASDCNNDKDRPFDNFSLQLL